MLRIRLSERALGAACVAVSKPRVGIGLSGILRTRVYLREFGEALGGDPVAA